MWIEVHDTLPDHYKTGVLARELKINHQQAVGIVIMLWLWALRQAPDGDLSRFTAQDISRAVGSKKRSFDILTALVKAGFVDQIGDTKHLHDWSDYAGRLIEKRRANAERMRRARAGTVQGTCAEQSDPQCAARAGATVPNLTIPNLTLGYDARAKGEKTVGDGPSSPGNGGAPQKEAANGESDQGHPGQHPGHPGQDCPNDRKPTLEERMREHARQQLENGGPKVYPF